MKKRVSATIDQKTKKLLDELSKKENYRNISHVIEDSIIQLYKKKKKRKNEK